MIDIKTALNPRDAKLLGEKIGQEWIPQNPRELILPFTVEKDLGSVTDSVEGKKIKAQAVYEKYGDIIKQSENILKEIEKTCKNATITLKPESEHRVMEAVRRVFGTSGDNITFEMYTMAIKKMAQRANKDIIRPQKVK